MTQMAMRGSELCIQIGLKVEGVELPRAEPAPPASVGADVDGSVLLIGMRGSGKTHVGALAAHALGWPLVDADAHFGTVHGTGVRAFVDAHGWPAFRAAEAALLRDLLAAHPARTVLSLGGGVVETPEARAMLKDWGKKGRVVHVVRAMEEVVKYLGEETARPAYGEPVEDVWRRREPWFAECCTHEFINHTTGLVHVGVGPLTSSVRAALIVLS
jgi:pentafunctional AROM polypeptide